MSRLRASAGVAFLLLAATTAGCGAAAETVVEQATGSAFDIDEAGTSTLETDGATATVGGDTPAVITDAVALPDGFQPTSSVELEDSITVNGEVPGDDIAAVATHFEDRLAADGWDVERRSSGDSRVDLRAEADAQRLQIAIQTDGQVTLLNVLLNTES